MSRPRIVAHAGGGAHAPENTMSAFNHALANGAEGIELDVHQSADGELVVIHDFDLRRVAGVDLVIGGTTAAELRRHDVGSWFTPRGSFAGERIPLLREVLELEGLASIWLNIELKAGHRIYPAIEERVLKIVEEFGRKSTTTISSFDHHALRRIKEIDARACVGVLHGASLIDAHTYANRIPADALHPNYQVVDAPYCEGARSAGLAVNAWTVNDPKVARELAAIGVDSIITDDVVAIRRAIEETAG